MSFLGDFLTTDTVYCYFCTVQATGAPTTLSGTPKLRCYKAGSTTESSDLTPTVDFDSRTGLNLVSIDLTGDSGFYAAQNDYNIVITAGTVNSVSAVGYVVGTFSVRNRGAIVNALGPIASASTLTARDIGASVLLSAGSGTGQLDFTSGVVKSNLSQILGTALTETSGQIAAGFKKFFNIGTPAATMDHLVLVDTATNVTNDVGITQAAADKSWSTTTRALTDKVGFALSTAGILAIWHQLTAAVVTASTMGKLIVDYLDAAISSRSTVTTAQVKTQADQAITDAALATATALAAAKTVIDAINAKTTNLPASPADETLIIAATNSLAAAIAALNNLSSTQAQAAAAAALAAYPAAKPSDVPSAATVAAAVQTSASTTPLPANVKKINGVAVNGTGVLGDEWLP